ncbi:MAG: GNAT family N-acetyltransferase [Ignavibacteria bacterium]|jgi:long-subunit acyl-CoA synthetase (AMP-forming)/N-acetylglutamate synthase-like GNAT family acetyltransferase
MKNPKDFLNILLGGKASIEEENIKSVCTDFAITLKEAIDNNFIQSESHLEAIQNILEAVIPSQLVRALMKEISTDLYYDFGIYLKEGYAKKIDQVIHHYLDLFRYSEFLERIYGERKWDDLIYRLIVLSNFTVDKLFKQRTNNYGNKTLFKILKGSKETNYSWDSIYKEVEKYRTALVSQMKDCPEENFKTAFLLENSLTMVKLDLACLTSGIVNIMIPANSVPHHIVYILNKTEAGVLFVTNEKQLAKIKVIKNELLHLRKVVLLEGKSAEDWVMSLDEFLSPVSDGAKKILENLRNKTTALSTATIMFTSGTTGEPKGIIFSQVNIVYKRFCRAMALPKINDDDRYLAYLPLFHTFGRYLEMTGAIFWGAEYVFMENPSAETMVANMQQVKPSIFISVPKKWMQLYERITSEVDIEFDDEETIKNKVNEITGGNLKWGLSAAGYLPPDIFMFFQKYGVEVMSGFGMTEATGGITMTPPNQYIENSLGKELPGIEIKVAEDGELLIRGNYVMKGYYGESSEETFDGEGWFATGDIMKRGENGFIEIIDRKKEIYKNIKGETIAPQKIENLFRDFDLVKQVFLVGDHRPYNTVLIYPNYESEKIKVSEFDETQRRDSYSSVVAAVNNFLAPFESIVDFRIIERPISAEYDELTPKGTFKRRVIENNFARVIDTMYEKDHIDLYISGLDIRVPNWFLREKGCLSGDIKAAEGKIVIKKLNSELKVSVIDKDKHLIRIGNYIYKITSRYIDLQIFLTNPIYWIGNDSLLKFTGDSIFQWYRQSAPDGKIEFYNTDEIIAPNEIDFLKLQKIDSEDEASLNGLNTAVVQLQSGQEKYALFAASYLNKLMLDDTLQIYKLTKNILLRPQLTTYKSVRRRMFLIASKYLKTSERNSLFDIYLARDKKLLNKNLIREFVKDGKGIEYLETVEFQIQKTFKERSRNSDFKNTSLQGLLNLLCSLGIRHPARYKQIRQIFVRYQLTNDWEEFSILAGDLLTEVRTGFREWLGENKTVAVDVETGEEYGWEDVLAFEPDVLPEDKDAITKAVIETPLIREAIFLFSKGMIIQLNNILPSGIWISHIGDLDYMTSYRVTVQTRYQGAFEFVININKKLSLNEVREEVNWQILASSKVSGQILAGGFGGLWDTYNMWTREYVSGGTVYKFIKRTFRKKDFQEKRLYHLWPFFVWNAATAYYNFWKLTGYKKMIERPSYENIVIPVHDYQTGTRLVSITYRTSSDSIHELLQKLDEFFIKAGETKFPFLRRNTIWNYVFSGIINAEGTEKGVQVLAELLQQKEKLYEIEKSNRLENSLKEFLSNIEKNGFIPKRLYFAIKRFHRWFRLNKDATASAQAEMINELYETYRLSFLELSFPATRTRFFYETVFLNSSKNLRSILKEIITEQRRREISNEDALSKFSNIKNELEISGDEEYFISRLTYPYLKPADFAELIYSESEGAPPVNLVVQYLDYDGNPFSIRKPVSPKEISRLHQLFLEENLMVTFKAEHQFLVAISDRGYIIGGLFYYRSSESTVHMDKIVVSERYRRLGIGDKLMNELFNRQLAEKIDFITTGFFRPEYFYKFGFKIEKKYTGLVKELKKS